MDRKNRSVSRLTAVILGCVISLAAQVAVAEGTLACHVLTKKEHPGVIFVQTDDKKTAHKVALGAMISTGKHSKASVDYVVECINFPQGRFSNAAMQAAVEKMPR